MHVCIDLSHLIVLSKNNVYFNEKFSLSFKHLSLFAAPQNTLFVFHSDNKDQDFFPLLHQGRGSIKSEEKKNKEKEEGEEIKITNLNNTSAGFLVLKSFQTQIFSSVR